jgi:hydrogenase maturation factor
MNPGKISENVLVRSILKNIRKDKNIDKGAAVGNDCAFFNGKTVSTGYVANETMPEKGKVTAAGHAIQRAVNNMVAAGGKAEAVTLSISLPENYREIKLKELMTDAARHAEKSGIAIVGGHTETVKGIECPIITATLVGSPIEGYREAKARPGQAIVMTKWMAMSGSALLAREKRDILKTKLPLFLLDDTEELERFYSVEEEAAVAVKLDVTTMHDIADGGVFAGLWQLAEKNGVGIEVDLKSIPVRQETIEVCEFFDINPYKLRSDGSLLIVTDKPEELIKELTAKDIAATLIGRVTDGHDKVIVASEEEHRFLEQPRQDEITIL